MDLNIGVRTLRASTAAQRMSNGKNETMKSRKPVGRIAQTKSNAKPTRKRKAVEVELSDDGETNDTAKKSSIVVLKLKSEKAIMAFEKLANPNAEVVGETATPKPGLTMAAPTAAVMKMKANAEFEENQAKPKPCGLPEVWADERQPLCESISFAFNAYQCGTYQFDGVAYGLLLDKDRSQGGHIDDQIIICRTGGGFQLRKDGSSVQVKDHSPQNARVACFEQSRKLKVPIVVILGKSLYYPLRSLQPAVLIFSGHNNTYCPTAMPHRYCVLGMFYVTAVWPEHRGGRVIYRVRLEKMDLTSPSWWAAKDSLDSSEPTELIFEPPTTHCGACGKDSVQIYEQSWYCLNSKCNPTGLLKDGSTLTDFTYAETYIKQRTTQNAMFRPAYNLTQAPLAKDPSIPDQASGRTAWLGLVCPKCGCCMSREDWDEWKCRNEPCDFVHQMKHDVICYKECLSTREYDGHALPLDNCNDSVKDLGADILGEYRLHSFELLPDNFVMHIMANKHTNAKPNGPNDIFHTVQGENLHLRRLRMNGRMVEGEKLTRHFAHNYGREYKYIAKANSTPFKDAPKVVTRAMGRLNWAAKVSLKGKSFEGLNEVLAVGYMVEMGMGYHDDGEKGIGPVVVSLSLGGDAEMTWRLKDKYYLPKHMAMKNIESYNPTKPVRKGSKFWEERMILNNHARKLTKAAFNAKKQKLFETYTKSKNAHCPPVVTLLLKHGDYMIMNGDIIQKYYEHQVKPSGNKLRFALTARTICATEHGIAPQDLWHSEYNLAPEDVYNGD